MKSVARIFGCAPWPSAQPQLFYRYRTRPESRPWPCRSPKKLFFHPLNVEIRHRRSNSDINAAITGLRALHSGSSRAADPLGRKKCMPDCRSHCVPPPSSHRPSYRREPGSAPTKYFRIRQVAGRGNIVENRRAHKVSGCVLCPSVAAIKQNFRTLLPPRLISGFDPFLACCVTTGPICTRSPQTACRRRGPLQRRQSSPGKSSALRQSSRQYRDRKAALSGASECAVADDLRRHRHIRVRQEDDMILRAYPGHWQRFPCSAERAQI